MTAISKGQTSMSTCLPIPRVAVKLPALAISMQAIPSHLSNGEMKQPLSVVSKPVQQPIKKVAISRSWTSANTCLPVPTAVIKLPAFAVPMRTIPSRPSRDESKLLLRAMPKPLQTTKKVVISKCQTNMASSSPLILMKLVPLTRSTPASAT